MVLRDGDEGPVTTLASLFRVVRSLYGYGNATFLLRDPQMAGARNACYCEDDGDHWDEGMKAKFIVEQ